VAGPFDYLFNDSSTSNNLPGVTTSIKVDTPSQNTTTGSTYVEPDPTYVEPDPAIVDGFNVNNVILSPNNRRYPTFKDPETAAKYETGLRNFMRATDRTDMDPYGRSGMFYRPGINRRLGREGGRFGNNGLPQVSIDAINRLAYNQYLGLQSGIGFRRGGKYGDDPVPGYAPALKLGSDTPGGKVVAAPQPGGSGSFLPPLAGLFESLFGSPNTMRTLDNMGVDYSNMGVDAAMGISPVASGSSVATVNPNQTSSVATVNPNQTSSVATINPVIVADSKDEADAFELLTNLKAEVPLTPAEMLAASSAPSGYSGPFTSQVAQDIYMSGSDTPVSVFSGGIGTGGTGDSTISSQPGVAGLDTSQEDIERSEVRQDFFEDLLNEFRRDNPYEPVPSAQSLAPSADAPIDLTAGLGEELVGTTLTAAIDRTDDPAFANVIESVIKRGLKQGQSPAELAAETNALMKRVDELRASGSSLVSAQLQAQAELNRRRAGVGG